MAPIRGTRNWVKKVVPGKKWTRHTMGAPRDAFTQTNNIIEKPIARYDFLPPHKRCNLRYAQSLNLTTGTAGVMSTVQIIRLNSLYDPDQTGGGHQPYLFDQIAALYSSYRVDNVKIELIWSTVGGTADIACCTQFSGSSGYLTMAGATLDAVTERNTVYSTMISPSGNSRVVKQTFNKKLYKIEGVSKKKYRDEDNYGALCSTNPALNINMSVAAGSPSGTAGENVTVQVVVTYQAYFYNRIMLAQS